MSYLKNLNLTPARKPPRIVVHGNPGSGKTSFAAHGTKPVVISDPHDEGIHTLKAVGLVPADVPVLPSPTDWQQFLEQVKEVGEAKHEYKTLVVDTVNGIEGLCYEYTLAKHFHGSKERFGEFGKGVSAMADEWKAAMLAFDRVRDRGMAVMLLAHTTLKNIKNPEGDNYDKYMPDMTPRLWGTVARWADCVLFATYDIATKKEGSATKAQWSSRVFRTGDWPAAECKNRWGLPSSVSMGDSGKEAWSNFVSAIIEAEKGAKDAR